MTTRSTVPSCVYGSVGLGRASAQSATSAIDAFGDGVAVTSVDEAAERRADAAGDHPDPADADVQDAGAERDDAEDERDLPMRRAARRRRCDGAVTGDPGRGRATEAWTLTGAGRPLDGGRGRTWAGRWSRRVVIAARLSHGVPCTGAEHSAAMVRCVVLWRGRARVTIPSRAPATEGWSAGTRSARSVGERRRRVRPGRPAVRGRPDRPGRRRRSPLGAGGMASDAVRLDGRPDRASACRTCGATSARTST